MKGVHYNTQEHDSMAKFEWQHADTCLPDYWSGHHLPHVSIPVFRGMSITQVRSAVRSEIAQGAIAGNDDNARLLSADMVRPEEEAHADKVTRKAYAAVNRIKSATRKRKLFMDLELEEEDQDYSVYAYFVLTEK